jgi:Domain of unknown function (DUF4928)
MKPTNDDFPLTLAEEEAIEALGGFDHVAARADSILQGEGFQRGFFTRSESRRIRAGRNRRKGRITFRFDASKSLRANVEDLLAQAAEFQAACGTDYVGGMLRHLVNATIDLELGQSTLIHQSFSVARHSTASAGTFQIESIAIHVTTQPTEALARKCGENLKVGLPPVIITLSDAVGPAQYLLKSAGILDRVDVLDAGQFLTANAYRRSLFKAAEFGVALTTLLQRYNAIVKQCEPSRSLLVDVIS